MVKTWQVSAVNAKLETAVARDLAASTSRAQQHHMRHEHESEDKDDGAYDAAPPAAIADVDVDVFDDGGEDDAGDGDDAGCLRLCWSSDDDDG